MSEFWSNFQTKAGERSRGPVPRFEVLMRIAQSTTLNGQTAPLFLLLGLRAGVHANSTPSTASSGSVPPGLIPQVSVWAQNPRLSLLRASCCC